ncbi:MAG: hypothetical protein CME55_06990 [Halieaceae bacterium]|nr:hypothetical protein [Halieaceae bacterium]HAN80516.1 hypothetical protein [Gammaproteobacteria bacterium]
MAHFVLILSHMLQQNGSLNEESTKRASRGAEIFKAKNADFIITSGGSERVHGDKPIAHVTRDFVIKKYGIREEHVIADTRPRDTVGDAYFVSEHLDAGSKVTVVTSAYHVNRVEHIFKFFLSDQTEFRVTGIDHPTGPKLIAHENKSLSEFKAQFPTRGLSRTALFEILRTEHPLYNGEIFTRLESAGG